jgi:CheY-like chemotaxis protein
MLCEGEQMEVRKKLLVVEDFEDNRFMSVRLLTMMGYDVTEATNGREALDLIYKQPFDAVLCDISMPVMGGMELLRRALEYDPRLPFIMVTADDTAEGAKNALRQGAFDYVTKPVDYSELEGTLRRAIINRQVFIVHGHDDAATEAVARAIEKLKLVPIILREQPIQGRTIIEQFQYYSKVGFAVVLLTPDDIGASRSKPKPLKPRARQNVIFELGYFIGLLGRSRVCVLYKEGVELPSDYHGVIYIQMDDSGAWRTSLTKEIKKSGIEVD